MATSSQPWEAEPSEAPRGDVQARHRHGEPAGGGGEESRALVLGEAQDGLGLGHGASGGRHGDARGRVYGAHDPVGAVG